MSFYITHITQYDNAVHLIKWKVKATLSVFMKETVEKVNMIALSVEKILDFIKFMRIINVSCLPEGWQYQQHICPFLLYSSENTIILYQIINTRLSFSSKHNE